MHKERRIRELEYKFGLMESRIKSLELSKDKDFQWWFPPFLGEDNGSRQQMATDGYYFSGHTTDIGAELWLKDRTKPLENKEEAK